jgi:hypothetical protein
VGNGDAVRGGDVSRCLTVEIASASIHVFFAFGFFAFSMKIP